MNGDEINQATFERKLITELRIKGGLKDENHYQKVLVWLYEATQELPSKVVLQFGIASGEEYVEKVVSLRFGNVAEITEIIYALMKAKVELGKRQKIYTPENFDLRLDNELNLVEDIWRGKR